MKIEREAYVQSWYATSLRHTDMKLHLSDKGVYQEEIRRRQ